MPAAFTASRLRFRKIFRSTIAGRDNRAGLAMVLPTTIIIIAIVIIPVIWNFILAFQQTREADIPTAEAAE